jgi:hypothetical protein
MVQPSTIYNVLSILRTPDETLKRITTGAGYL